MKIKWIEIENFQSIKHLRLGDFEEDAVIGFMGDNDSGKSAIGRALRILFYNDIGRGIQGFVRQGESCFKVTVGTHEGFVMSTTRGSKNFYELIAPDGSYTKMTKLERSTPEELVGIINAYIDPISGNVLNYRTIEDPLLLINNSGSDVYTIIQQSMNTLEVKDAIDRANAELKVSRDLVSNYEFQIQLNNEKIDSIVIIDEYEFLTAKEAIVNLSETISIIENILEGYEVEKELSNKLAELKEIEGLYDKIKSNHDTVKIIGSILENKERLDKIPASMRTSEEILGLGEKLNKNYTTVSLCNKLISAFEERDKVDRKLGLINDVVSMNLNGKMELAKLLDRTLSYVEENKKTKVMIKQSEETIEELKNKEISILNELGICPTCKQETAMVGRKDNTGIAR